MNMNDYAKRIISLFVGHRFSEKATARFYGWLTDGNHTEEKDKALRELYEKALQLPADSDLESALSKWRSRCGLSSARPRRRRVWIRLAAAAALLLLSVSLGISVLSTEKRETDLVQRHIPYSQPETLVLPDGTRVRLNSGSTLLYPEKFGRRGRSVFLIGEAGFKVQPDVKCPFIVKTDGFRVTALGTEFDVSAYPEDRTVSAVLLEGSVLVEYDNLAKKATLHPGQQLVFDKSNRSGEVKTPDIEDVTAWKRGELVFRQMSIADIITVLERRFDIAFIYRLHDISEDRYSFRFREDASLEEVMEVITDVTGILTFSIDGDKCRISLK